MIKFSDFSHCLFESCLFHSLGDTMDICEKQEHSYKTSKVTLKSTGQFISIDNKCLKDKNEFKI